jgi:hypothetical protein
MIKFLAKDKGIYSSDTKIEILNCISETDKTALCEYKSYGGKIKSRRFSKILENERVTDTYEEARDWLLLRLEQEEDMIRENMKKIATLKQKFRTETASDCDTYPSYI